MDTGVSITDISSVIQDLGVWAVFAWLYLQERRAHMQSVSDHMDDLREIAGVKAVIGKVPAPPAPPSQ